MSNNAIMIAIGASENLHALSLRFSPIWIDSVRIIILGKNNLKIGKISHL
jgi:hypothetical protein